MKISVKLIFYFSILYFQFNAFAQDIPKNPFLADSPWPIYHQNNYAQASTELRGPEPGDKLSVKFVDTQSGIFPVSPWSQFSEKYPNGDRVVWGSSATHIFKVLVSGDKFELVDSYRIDRNPFSFKWNFITLKNNKIIVINPIKRTLLKFSDINPSESRSKIKLERVFTPPKEMSESLAHLTMSYDGNIIFTSQNGFIGAISPEFKNFVFYDMKQLTKDLSFHNAPVIDENGNIFIVSNKAMSKFKWDGKNFSLTWRAPYNFRGTNCPDDNKGALKEFLSVVRGEGCTGSGTTPTLLGTGSDDKLVFVADSYDPNNIVSFWRDAIPDGWQGLNGYDPHIASITPLPYSTWKGDGFTAENSPAAFKNELITAQWNGFHPKCNPVNGVQKLRWNSVSKQMELAWVNNLINFNNVITYSAGSNLAYGTGRKNCIYYFWAVDWDTGEVKIQLPLGDSSKYLDQGNQISLNDDRSLIFGSSKGIVRISLIDQ